MKTSVAVAAAAAALVTGLAAGIGVSAEAAGGSAAGYSFSKCIVPSFQILFDGKTVQPTPFELVPGNPEEILCNGNTYLPLRFAANAMGASVLFDPFGPSVKIYAAACNPDPTPAPPAAAP